jgi:hypothetical protein
MGSSHSINDEKLIEKPGTCAALMSALMEKELPSVKKLNKCSELMRNMKQSDRGTL